MQPTTAVPNILENCAYKQFQFKKMTKRLLRTNNAIVDSFSLNSFLFLNFSPTKPQNSNTNFLIRDINYNFIRHTNKCITLLYWANPGSRGRLFETQTFHDLFERVQIFVQKITTKFFANFLCFQFNSWKLIPVSFHLHFLAVFFLYNVHTPPFKEHLFRGPLLK